jgi:hypothetical protein
MTKSQSCWVLTYEVNDYDQHGEYFLMCWPYKPSDEQLRAELEEDGSVYSVEHVKNNLGRTKPTGGPDRSYNFREVFSN